MLWTIVGIVVAVVTLVIGLALIFEWWKPFKNDKGEKVPLSKKEKWVTGILTMLGIMGLFALLVALDVPLFRKIKVWCAKCNNGKTQNAPAGAR